MAEREETDAEALHVLIVDDEQLARQRLATLLSREKDVEIVGMAASGGEAVAIIEERRSNDLPLDVVFLDVQMPGASGLDVIQRVGLDSMPATIFVTAYDQHALAAFELAAVDYLLKPFENERFRAALSRAREIIRLRKLSALHQKLRRLLEADDARRSTTEPVRGTPSQYLERLAVEMRGRVRVVPVDSVDHFSAEGNYVRVKAGEETFLISDTLAALEERLDPARFFRIHRSTIVRLDRIESLLLAPGGDYAVRLHDGTRLNVARARKELLSERLGLRT